MQSTSTPPTTIDEARELAVAVGYPVVDDGIRETERWWFFPVRQIGCLGVVVDKRDGATTLLGSAFTIEDWLWGYDAGIFRGKSSVIDLVVSEVTDLERAIDGLAAIGVCRGDRWWIRDALEHLPVRFEGVCLWMRLPEVRALDQSAFSWHVEPSAPYGERFARSTNLPPGRWRSVTPTNLEELGDSLVFTHAIGSPRSGYHGRALGLAILEFPDVVVSVLDIETVTPAVALALGGARRLRGGEMFWLRSGQIVALRTARTRHVDIAATTRQWLADRR